MSDISDTIRYIELERTPDSIRYKAVLQVEAYAHLSHEWSNNSRLREDMFERLKSTIMHTLNKHLIDKLEALRFSCLMSGKTSDYSEYRVNMQMVEKITILLKELRGEL